MLQLPDWYTFGRQNAVWKTFRYIPTGWVDLSGSTGLMREVSRAWEVRFYPSLPFTLSLSVHELTAMQHALGDFAVHQVAIALDKSGADIGKCANRPMNFVNMWDPSVTSNGFSGFAQWRYPVCFILPPLCSNIHLRLRRTGPSPSARRPHAAWSIPWGTRVRAGRTTTSGFIEM
jgi:hypothetical protein